MCNEAREYFQLATVILFVMIRNICVQKWEKIMFDHDFS